MAAYDALFAFQDARNHGKTLRECQLVIRQDGIITLDGKSYRVHAGNTKNPTVYVQAKHQGGRTVERRLRANGSTAMRVVGTFRRRTTRP